MNKLLFEARIKDSLYLLADKSGANIDYARGSLIGIVSAMQAFGYDFKDAWREILRLLPDEVRVSAIPTAWVNLDDKWTLKFSSEDLVNFPDLLNQIPEEMREVPSQYNEGYTCRDEMLDKYLHIMSILQRETDRVYAEWNSDLNGDPALEPQIKHCFFPFRLSGSQYIAEWSVSDMRKEFKNTMNWHGQNTSRWLYAGCLLVQDGRVSIHT
jgi:hypothetical protein